jgi:transcriptional regulator with XRE-family HTH domain
MIEENHLSIGNLEKKSGLKKNAIRNIIEGRSKNPNIDTLTSIASTMGCSIDSLINATDNRNILQDQYDANSPHLWDYQLFEQTTYTVKNLLDEKKSNMHFENILELIKEIYLFSLEKENENGNKDVDVRFAKWLVNKNLT